MEKYEYTTLFHVEDTYWWYVGLHHMILAMMKRMEGKSGNTSRILDAGCGTGRMTQLATKRGYALTPMDLAPEAIGFLKERDIHASVRASILDIPFCADYFDGAISLDVVCCLERADAPKALAEIYRVLRPGGRFIIEVPAYESLRSEHDTAVHTRHRYRRCELRRLLEQAGFHIERATYRNTFFFPLAILVRLIKKPHPAGREPISDLKLLPAIPNAILTWFLKAENWLVAKGISLPFGLSVFIVGRK